MIMRRFAIAASAALLVAGCQTVEPPATASGKPEVTIKAPVAAIKARLVSLAMDRHFNVTKDTEYLLQFEKPTDNLGASVLLGSRYDAVPAERIIFTFASIENTTRVVASSMYVTNPGSAFERVTPINAGEGVDRTQNTLNELKLSMEMAIAPAVPSLPASANRRAVKPTS
jgi:hypothetical protein